MQDTDRFRSDFHLFDAAAHGLHGGSGETWDWALAARRRAKVPLILAGGLTADNVAEAIDAVHPYAVDVASGVEAAPGVKDPAKVRAFLTAVKPRPAAAARRERRRAPLRPLRRPVRPRDADAGAGRARAGVGRRARATPASAPSSTRLLRDYGGRPSPLYHAARLSEAAGRPVWLKREDLDHTGAHKINNALGQGLLAVRMGKRRIIAETGAGQHGVATATACALLGLECIVYMGTEDIRRQQPNVQRMGLLGRHRRAGVDAGARTLKEAVSAAIRDWVANVGDTHYVIGSAVGPAPFPALVRDLQRVIGDEARAQLLEARAGCPRA